MMSVILKIPPTWRQEAGEERIAELSPGSLKEVLEAFIKRYPALAARVWEPDGEVNPSLNFFINKESVRYLQGLNTSLQEGDEIDVVTMISGG